MPLNAVERRLLDLRYQWEGFADDPVPRLLVWTVPDAAMRLVRCFLEVQKQEGEYVTRDLFIVFDAPFENSIQYSRALKEALAGQHAASRDDLAREGLDPVWRTDVAGFPDSAYGFIQTLCSFGSTYHEAIGNLVAVLTPAAVSNAAHFAAWLARTLDAGLPERLRLLALDSLEAPHLADMEPANLSLLRRESLALDATAVAMETFAQERGTGPAGVFRNMLMALVALVERGSAEQVQLKAGDALAYTRDQGWKDQQAVVTMIVAGALLKEQRFDDAIVAYQDARATATLAEHEGHPAGSAMVLQTWFGEAGVELAAGRVIEAAEAYENAAVAAQTARNTILTIEAFRMAAFCHARLGERDVAIERGDQALAVGERLKPDARGMTTLPIAATDLMRVLDADKTQAIDSVRERANGRVERLARAFEQHAVKHERTADPGVARAAEQTLARGNEGVALQAEQELAALVAGTSAAYQQAFARGRRLLGGAWPLGAAMVPATGPAQVAARAVTIAA
jgi:tetratricopeptide (TPR) repeat protein